MKKVDQSILRKIKRPAPTSHKGDNGRILIIAGSKKFHGAMLLAVQIASRIVDTVFVYSTRENTKLVKKLKSKTATFISVFDNELEETVGRVDAILIGPGIEEIDHNIGLTHRLLKNYPDKKFVIDATSLWNLDPKNLHKNCIITPHRLEFENVFKLEANAENVHKMAQKYGCIIAFTSYTDYISDGQELYVNDGGNAGLTKGGTGDVLSGMITALSANNDNLTATLAGIYLSSYAGDLLYKKRGTFYNAEDVIVKLGEIWKKSS